MGKYSGLKNALPRQIGHEPEEGDESNWNDEVVRKMAAFEIEYPTGITQLAERYSERRNDRDAKAAESKLMGQDVEALERLLIVRLEAVGLASVGLASGEKFRLDDKPSAKVIDPDKFIEFIKANGMEHLLSVHSGTRGAIATDRFRSGITETPGLELKLRTTIARDKKK